jgi:hypothetical protein
MRTVNAQHHEEQFGRCQGKGLSALDYSCSAVDDSSEPITEETSFFVRGFADARWSALVRRRYNAFVALPLSTPFL